MLLNLFSTATLRLKICSTKSKAFFLLDFYHELVNYSELFFTQKTYFVFSKFITYILKSYQCQSVKLLRLKYRNRQEALLLDEQCGSGYYEVVVLQRKLENHNRTCGYCKKKDDGLKRCTKCLKVAYCNQSVDLSPLVVIKQIFKYLAIFV